MNSFKNIVYRYFNHPEAISLLSSLFFLTLLLSGLNKFLTPFLLSVIISYFGSLLVKRLIKVGIHRTVSVVIVLTLFVTLVILFVVWLLPLLWNQLRNLVNTLPVIIANLETTLIKLQPQFLTWISPTQIEHLIQQLSNYLTLITKHLLSFSLSSIGGLITLVIDSIMVPFLVFFLLRDELLIFQWLKSFLPHNRKILTKIWYLLQEQLQAYIKGKTLLFVLTGTVSIFTYQYLGLRYAVLLGFLTGLSVFIPYVGITIVTILVTAVALFQWGITQPFCYLMTAHAIINLLEANLLEPLFFAEILHLHPIIIILAVLLFGNLMGFWGILFAVPLAAFVKILLENWPIYQNIPPYFRPTNSCSNKPPLCKKTITHKNKSDS